MFKQVGMRAGRSRLHASRSRKHRLHASRSTAAQAGGVEDEASLLFFKLICLLFLSISKNAFQNLYKNVSYSKLVLSIGSPGVGIVSS